MTKKSTQAEPASGGNSAVALKQYIDQLEGAEREMSALREHKSDIMRKAKSEGFDATAIREILKYKKLSASKAQEREALFDTYRHALGLLPDYQ